jgi:predicted RecB family nuclease
MRRGNTGGIILSPSDLMKFQGCAHATALDLRRLKGETLVAAPDTASAKLLQAKSDAHERAFLETLAASGKTVASIDKDKLTPEAAHAATVADLEQGPHFIYQATLVGGMWAGFADFLERVDRPSKLGLFSYEVIDTKLKRTPTPQHVLQLALYSDLLAEIQGPAGVHSCRAG